MKPTRTADYAKFVTAFVGTALLVGIAVPGMTLSTALAAAYGGYGDEPLLAYGPLLLVLPVVSVSWVCRRKWPASRGANGAFFGSLFGVAMIASIVTLLLLK